MKKGLTVPAVLRLGGSLGLLFLSPSLCALGIDITIAKLGDNQVYLRFSEPVTYYEEPGTGIQRPLDENSFAIVSPGGSPAMDVLRIDQTGDLGGKREYLLQGSSLAGGGPDRFDLIHLLNWKLRTEGRLLADSGTGDIPSGTTFPLTSIGLDLVFPTALENLETGEKIHLFRGSEGIGAGELELQVFFVSGSGIRSTLFIDADVPDIYRGEDGAWSPYTPPPSYVPQTNKEARAYSPYSGSTDRYRIDPLKEGKDMDLGGRYEFFISTVFTDMSGNEVEIPCYFQRDSNDLSSYAAWSFVVIPPFSGQGFTPQKGGVTILGNVIGAQGGGRAVIVYSPGSAGRATIEIYTLSGSLVKVLFRGDLSGGTYRYTWDGRNGDGQTVSRGMYLIRVRGPDIDEIRKVMVVR